jgi:transcription elongation factor Elf1
MSGNSVALQCCKQIDLLTPNIAPKMSHKTRLKSPQVWYLDIQHMDKCSNVTLISKDGSKIRINSLILACFVEFLQVDTTVIITNLASRHLSMIVDFCSKGILPSLLSDNDDINKSVFKSFGINLEEILKTSLPFKADEPQVIFEDNLTITQTPKKDTNSSSEKMKKCVAQVPGDKKKKSSMKILLGGSKKSFQVCHLCGKAVTSIYMHKKSVHHIDQLDCQICQRTFKNKLQLSRHLSVHSKIPCELCGEMIDRKRKSVHVQTKHMKPEDREFKCHLCSKGFVTSQRLSDHVNTHTGQRPYICQSCGKSFASHGNFYSHKKASGHLL